MSFLYQNKPNDIPYFGLCIQTSIPATNVMKVNIAPCCSSPTPPWLWTTPTILFDLLQSNVMQILKKSNTPIDIYISKYNEIRIMYPQHIPIFTDGSKQSNHTATAVVLKSHIITIRLFNSVSVYTCELYAILLTLNKLSIQQHKHYLLFNSLSSLNSIVNKNANTPIKIWQSLLTPLILYSARYQVM